MGTVVALGERARTSGFALAGVLVRPAEEPDGVRAAWEELPGDIALVILTQAAAAALGPDVLTAPMPLTVVMPP
ncbi:MULTISPECIES: V-type ATP synthase subunit F [Streptomyces]|uniref:V-type ATP synthase subunit F n=1 Tax=Streptomyces TaxID=1883 RepID=UPI001F369C48|nr:V-type ATP synthase subunit F [Streptomyces sp. MOE7]